MVLFLKQKVQSKPKVSGTQVRGKNIFNRFKILLAIAFDLNRDDVSIER